MGHPLDFGWRGYLSVLAFCWRATAELLAQAPDAIAGRTLECVVTGGSGSFAAHGTYRLLPSAGANRCVIVPLTTNIAASSGSYVYATLTPPTATLQFTDPGQGPGFDANYTFNSASAGVYTVTNPAVASDTQQGTFTVLAGPVPSSIVGVTITVSVTSGVSPYAATGSALFVPAPDGSYKIIGLDKVQNSTGTYTYQTNSPTTAVLSLTDAQLGAAQEQLFFGGANSGTYALQDAAGALLQTGTFTYTLPVGAAPVLSAPRLVNQQFQFTLAAQANQSYTVEFTPALVPAAWQTLASIPTASAPTNVVITDPLGNGPRYYRVRTP